METSNLIWPFKKRLYWKEKHHLNFEETFSHPLKGVIFINNYEKDQSNKKNQTTTDPLSAMSNGYDPLSLFAAESQASHIKMTKQPTLNKQGSNEIISDDFECWDAKKVSIFAKYKTSELLTISVMSSSGAELSIKSVVNDNLRNRVEQLDDIGDGSLKEMLNLNQQEFIKKIEDLNNDLKLSWQSDQRVKSLKIVIQCTKLLSDLNAIMFYPSKFVLVTDILDTFGRLVFERIREKAKNIKNNNEFKYDQVPETAKETCKNWFYKIASIRELLPRFYIECAILKCHQYLKPDPFKANIIRLSQILRGIGDPLVAIYARCYLCRVVYQLDKSLRNQLMGLYTDLLMTFSQIRLERIQSLLSRNNIEIGSYMNLYIPALDWLMQCISYKASDEELNEILKLGSEKSNSGILLHSVLSSFHPSYIVNNCIKFTDMIKDCKDVGISRSLLFKRLGTCCVLAQVPDVFHLNLLNNVWNVVMKLTDTTEYIGCAEVWIEFVIMNFKKKEINTILGDILKHVTPDRAFEDHYDELQSILTKILKHMTDFSMLFSLDNFLPFVDLFQKESIRIDICQLILENFKRVQNDVSINDEVLINSVLFICRMIHDCVNALTLQDDVRHITLLIVSFIQLVNFGHDFERQLTFFVECRSSFSNLDGVTAFLVHRVNVVTMHTKKIVKGIHSSKTASFVRACVAYCFITIPSLYNLLEQFRLYIISGEVALCNNCLSQADACFKAAITLLKVIPNVYNEYGKSQNIESILVENINRFLSVLLFVPDNPNVGMLYLLRGLLNAIDLRDWESGGDGKITIYISVINLVSSLAQDDYIYRLNGVDADDRLYGSSEEFVSELNNIMNNVFKQILLSLQELKELNRKRFDLNCQRLIHVIFANFTLNSQVQTLLIKLLKMISNSNELITLRKRIQFVARNQKDDINLDIILNFLDNLKT